MRDAFVLDGLRTPFGRHGGALAGVRPDDLAGGLIRALVARLPAAAVSRIEDVVLGCACQAGEDGRNVGRNAALIAGLPAEVPGATVNRLCGSSLTAVVDAARAVRVGEGDLVLAGGVESMSRAPFVMAKAETAYARDVRMFDTTIGSRFPNPALVGPHGDDTMPQTADNVARDLGIGREDCDAFALRSQQAYERARCDGVFDDEIHPVTVTPPSRKAQPRSVDADEHPRPETTAESLARLRPLAADGVVTAGNASGINDGAALVLVGGPDMADATGMMPLARIVTAAVAGVPPRVMGLGPVPASAKALERAGLRLDDMDLIEINEAFAAQVIGCCRQMGLAPDDPRLNPDGGAIAVGHPLGASGARLVLHAARALRRLGGRYALVTLCIGVGQGIAVVLEAA
jgi:acetyl-CoA C-acetyltransferase